MKKFKINLSVFMVLVIISISILPSFAVVAPEDSVTEAISPADKIDDMVRKKMLECNVNEKIPVWVWFSDIDNSNIEAMVEKQTGLTKNDLSVEVDVDTVQLTSALDEASVCDSSSTRSVAKAELEAYMQDTKDARKLERERTNTYLRAKRSITSELYVANNTKIIKDLGIDDNEIEFQSILTPSAIMNLTEEEIVEISENDDVSRIMLYVEESNEEVATTSTTTYDKNKDTMQVDAVEQMYSYTGDNINVLMYEQSYVRSDANDIDNFDIDLSKVVVVVNGREITPYNVEEMDNNKSNHSIYVASTLQKYASNVNIYSTADYQFDDIEWTLLNKNIHIINASTFLGEPSSYSQSSSAMWFDSLAYTYDVPLIASAGNFTETTTNLLAPACGYNTIAVGAYGSGNTPADDRMFDFKYAPISGTDLPTYKPDVVIAAGDTSSAAPALTGILSIILEAKQSLASHPETIKAILMASCHRKVAPYGEETSEEIESGLTMKQGAGAIDAYRALKIALEGTYGENTVVESNEATATRFTLNEKQDVNVSIAWFINNSYFVKSNANAGSISNPFDPGEYYDIYLGNLQELELRVYDGATKIGESEKLNSYKQMAYMKNLEPNKRYRVAINKLSPSNMSVTYGYAWSGKNYEQAQMEITGKTAVGQTLTSSLTYIDGKVVPATNVSSYVWEKSDDGVNWQVITGANTSAYTLTSDERNKYIKCEAVLNDTTYSSDTSVEAETDIKIVRYGDVDMDGSISPMDTYVIQNYMTQQTELTAEQFCAADVDGNGVVNGDDAYYIQSYIALLITSFPVEG